MKKYLFLFVFLYIFFFFALVQVTSPVSAIYPCNTDCSQNVNGCDLNATRSCYNISGVGWRCRTDACINETSCTCPTPTPTPTSTPTPTPTPTSTPWTKIKNSSFGSPANLTNIIALNIIAYDADDDVNQRYFIMTSAGNDPGLVSAASINTGTANVSNKNWKVNYTQATTLTPALFTQYVKSRKEYQVVTDLSNLAQDKINLWQGDLTINNQANFNNKKVVLIVTGTATLDVPNFQPANAASAILAQTINFTSSVNYAEGIFIAQTVNTGSTINQGLKINGNLVALGTLSNGRSWSNNNKPSLFIIFNANQYLSLLPYLSTASYQWNQIQ